MCDHLYLSLVPKSIFLESVAILGGSIEGVHLLVAVFYFLPSAYLREEGKEVFSNYSSGSPCSLGVLTIERGTADGNSPILL